MGQTFTVGRFFDIRLGVHVSWIAVYLFMTVSIATGISSVSRGTAVGLAAVCALALFASVVAHEFAHAFTARRYGVRTRAITLFLFGGIATLECEPPSPRADAAIALAGPAASALLGALAFGLFAIVERSTTGAMWDAVGLVVAYIALANGVLAVFNLIPAFPMDGGRVLRAAIWRARKSHAAATAAASMVGLVFAACFIAAGVVAGVATRSWQYAWYAIMGGFLFSQGWMQYRDARRCARLERAA